MGPEKLIADQGERRPPAELVIITKPAQQPGLFEVRLKGQQKVLATSRQPFFEAARTLLKVAHGDPETILVMLMEGSDTVCARGKLALAARLTVVERKGRQPIFEEWEPHQLAEGIE